MKKKNKVVLCMRYIFLYLSLAIGIEGCQQITNFMEKQKESDRVKQAIAEKEESIKKQLSAKNIALDQLQILLVAYKAEGQLVLYVKNAEEEKYQQYKTYPICQRSGVLGPKRKEGDKQVPEGFYYIDRFNPKSNYYLSLGINYPNDADRKKSKAKRLGGDIFIHGSCVTVGCLPMTDDLIKEIYLYALYAHENGQKEIPVYIFPFKMDSNNFKSYKKQYQSNKELWAFWENIGIGYQLFQEQQKELIINTNSETGDYVFENQN